MISLLKTIYEELSMFCENVYLEKTDKVPGFPYIVYKYHMVPNDRMTDEFYIDIDIYDDVSFNTIRTEQLYWDIVKHFKGLKILDCGKLMQVDVTNGSVIPTDQNVRRRWIELKIKTNWRD